MLLKTKEKDYLIIIADTFYKRLTGLIGKKNINFGMLFPKCNSIHTYFMQENIDIIGLDENNEVIYKYENLNKNRVIRINNDIKKTSILEMPAKSTSKIRIGSILIFEDN